MDIKTPAFVLYEERIKQNLEVVQKVKDNAGVDIILAFKGFAMWSVFPMMRNYISGATASSLNEVKLCHEEMKTKSHSYFVAYQEEEFEEVVKMSSHITFNSLSQYSKFIDQVPETIEVGLRINPGWSDVETELYNPSSSESRLGISLEELKELPERVTGLHCHVLCESDASSTAKLLNVLGEKFSKFFSQLKWINIGGGHLMTRAGYDLNLLIDSLKDFKEKYELAIILEPGSAFAWQTGNLITSVVDIVTNGGKKTAIIDASFTCHMPDCLEMPYRPDIKEGSKENVSGFIPYQLGGLSCLAGDFLDNYWFEKPLKVGHKITFKDMMHYTMVKTTMFNGVKHPNIVLRNKMGSYEMIREFEYKDFKSRLS